MRRLVIALAGLSALAPFSLTTSSFILRVLTVIINAGAVLDCELPRPFRAILLADFDEIFQAQFGYADHGGLETLSKKLAPDAQAGEIDGR
jgi:hypothetical protein